MENKRNPQSFERMRMSETKNQGIPQVTEWGLSALAPQNKMKGEKKKRRKVQEKNGRKILKKHLKRKAIYDQ